MKTITILIKIALRPFGIVDKYDIYMDIQEAILKLQNGGQFGNGEFAPFRNNFDVVMEAVKQKGYFLEYAHRDMKDNEDIVREAVLCSDNALKFASPRLRNDKRFVLQCVIDRPYAISEASANMKEDIEIAQAVIKIDLDLARFFFHKDVLHQLGYGLPIDKSEAMRRLQNGDNFKYEEYEPYRNDKDVVLVAVMQKGDAFNYASSELKTDREVVKAAVRQNGRVLKYIHELLRDDIEIVTEALEEDFNVLQFASNKLNDNESLVMEAIVKNPCCVYDVSERLKDNEKVILEVARKQPCIAIYASSPRIKKMIGNGDPVKILEAAIFKEELRFYS